MNRILKLAALLGVFLAGINGARADVHEAVRKGQKVRLLPAAESAEPEKAPNILMTLLVGGEPVDLTQSWQLDIYPGDKASGKPAYSLSSRELAVSHKTSRCRPELVERMNRDAMSGQALFCNQSLELERLGFFELKKPGAKTRTATSPVVNYQEDGLIAITVWLH